MNFTQYLRIGRNLFFKREVEDPLYVVFFVTENCTCRCRHCLLGERPKATGELLITEIEQISASMKEIMFLLLTGGEPFLREDLPELVRIFCRNNKVRNIGMPTNGSLTEKVVRSVEEILKTCPDLYYAVDISFDAVGEEHNKIRGHRGLFEKACWTYRELAKLEKFYPNFNLNVDVTISTLNQDKLFDLYQWLRDNLGVVTVNQLLVRGRPRDPLVKGVDIEKYRKFSEFLDFETLKGGLIGYRRFPFSDFVNAMKALRHKIIEGHVIGKKAILPCYAASLSAIITSKGMVYPCELLNTPLGDLRKVGYDFQKIWHSAESEQVRKFIKDTGCFCTYECFLTNSVFFTPRMFPSVLKEWYNIKKARHKLKKEKINLESLP